MTRRQHAQKGPPRMSAVQDAGDRVQVQQFITFLHWAGPPTSFHQAAPPLRFLAAALYEGCITVEEGLRIESEAQPL